jgi:hypothetical protein
VTHPIYPFTTDQLPRRLPRWIVPAIMLAAILILLLWPTWLQLNDLLKDHYGAQCKLNIDIVSQRQFVQQLFGGQYIAHSLSDYQLLNKELIAVCNDAINTYISRGYTAYACLICGAQTALVMLIWENHGHRIDEDVVLFGLRLNHKKLEAIFITTLVISVLGLLCCIFVSSQIETYVQHFTIN